MSGGSVYVAVRDRVPGQSRRWRRRRDIGVSQIIGVFSTEPKARAACDEDAAEDQLQALKWPLLDQGTDVRASDGSVYDVIMLTVDVPLGEG